MRLRQSLGYFLLAAPSVTVLSFEMEEFLKLINNERVNKGFGKLTISKELCSVALDQALYMRYKNKMVHQPNLLHRATDSGYKPQEVAENIADGYTDAVSLFNAWNNSPDHRTNMLNKAYTETCVIVKDRFAAQALGVPRPDPEGRKSSNGGNQALGVPRPNHEGRKSSNVVKGKPSKLQRWKKVINPFRSSRANINAGNLEPGQINQPGGSQPIEAIGEGNGNQRVTISQITSKWEDSNVVFSNNFVAGRKSTEESNHVVKTIQQSNDIVNSKKLSDTKSETLEWLFKTN